MHTYKTLVALLVIFAAQFPVRADTIYLTDGTKREGTIVEDDTSSVKIQIKHGPLSATVEIPRKEIARVEIKAIAVSEDELNFQILGKEAERLATLDKKLGAEAWLRYAKFCEEKTGYSGYAKTGYKKAIELNSDLAEARLALGYTQDSDGVWSKPEPETITVGPRYVPYQAPYSSVSPVYVSTNNDSVAAPADTYSTSSLDGRTSYTRNTYYSDDYGYRNNPVLYLGSVDGRLQPVSASQFWYGNNSNSYYSRPQCNTTYTAVQSGRTGYYSDSYYRSNRYGVSTQFSGNIGSTRVSGSINGGGHSGSNCYLPGTGTGVRFGFR